MMRGKKSTIREAKPTDVGLLSKWWSNGEIMSPVGFPKGIVTDKIKLMSELVYQEKHNNEILISKRYIIEDKNFNLPIGEMRYGGLDMVNKKCYVDIKICEINFQGKGYGYEVLNAFIDFLFVEFDLHKIELDTMLENVRAQNLYKKTGFKEIGIKRDNWIDQTGKYRNAVLMEILRKEWEELRKYT